LRIAAARVSPSGAVPGSTGDVVAHADGSINFRNLFPYRDTTHGRKTSTRVVRLFIWRCDMRYDLTD